MRVLVACEFSGRVRNAFLRNGHDAYSADLLCSLNPSNRHYQGDVTPLLQQRWDLVIAHPPCTYLCLSGAHWLHRQPNRFNKMLEAVDFFLKCLFANSARVCVENPIMHKKALSRLIPYRQIIQPYQFGSPARKSTCLWLINLPKLKPTVIVKPKLNRCRKHSYSYDHNLQRQGLPRHLSRSITYKGIAEAMANQWGSLPPL